MVQVKKFEGRMRCGSHVMNASPQQETRTSCDVAKPNGQLRGSTHARSFGIALQGTALDRSATCGENVAPLGHLPCKKRDRAYPASRTSRSALLVCLHQPPVSEMPEQTLACAYPRKQSGRASGALGLGGTEVLVRRILEICTSGAMIGWRPQPAARVLGRCQRTQERFVFWTRLACGKNANLRLRAALH